MKYVVTWGIGLRIEADNPTQAADLALEVMQSIHRGDPRAVFGVEDESATLHRVVVPTVEPPPAIDPMLKEFFPGHG